MLIAADQLPHAGEIASLHIRIMKTERTIGESDDEETKAINRYQLRLLVAERERLMGKLSSAIQRRFAR